MLLYLIGIISGIFWILLGANKLHRKNKFYLQVTDKEVNYRIPGKKAKHFQIENLETIGLYTSYITFQTKDGLRDMIDFPMMPYEAVRDFKHALQQIQVEMMDFRV